MWTLSSISSGPKIMWSASWAWSSATLAGGAETVMTGFALGLPSLALRIAMLDAVALCVKLNGRETSKEVDFCGRSTRSGPAFAPDFSDTIDAGGRSPEFESELSFVAVEKRVVTGEVEDDGKAAPKDGGETLSGGSEDGSDEEGFPEPEGAGMQLSRQSALANVHPSGNN